MPKFFFDCGFHFDAASCDHEVRLSGPLTPPAGYRTGISPWYGPYGTPVDQWTDVTHPTGDPAISYPASDPINPRPNLSWLFDAEIPAGWYTVVKKRKSV